MKSWVATIYTGWIVFIGGSRADQGRAGATLRSVSERCRGVTSF
jgi:hypothetical protein